MIQRIVETGLKLNAENSYFGQTDMEYIGFWVINDGVILLSSKSEAVKAMNVPTTVRDIRTFLALVNYYIVMWRKQAHTIAPIIKMLNNRGFTEIGYVPKSRVIFKKNR